MSFMQAIKMAFASILSNKMRSLLTMLGVIIGVFAVTMIMTLGRGATGEVMGQLEGLGANLVTVNIRGERNLAVNRAETLKDRPGVLDIAPVLNANTTVRVGNNSLQAGIEATTPSFETLRNAAVAQGRFLEQNDLNMRFRVAVVGLGVAEELFGTHDVLGKRMMINRTEFVVIGVLEESEGFGGGGGMGPGGGRGMGPGGDEEETGSDDERLIIPLTTGQRVFRNANARTFHISADSPETVEQAVWEIESFLMKELRDEDNYSVFNQSDLLATIDETMATLTMMLAGLAGISLLVGGIGIMNIMLVSVSERTREIGIRKAIGAKRKDMMVQFLVESAVVSGVGGILGVLLGFLGAGVLEGIMNIPLAISLDVILLATGFSIGVGLVFGLYPAAKASKMRPIEALRHE